MAWVHALSFEHPWSADSFGELLDGPGVFGLLAGEGAPVGIILCRVAAGEMEVLTVGVDPAARRRGVGRALVLAAVDAGRQAGAETAFLEVAVDNGAAANLYARLGFREAGMRRGYYDRGQGGRVDAQVMRLDLRGA
jgi:ribosomal-protein-alanine N-acetyltransferase